MGQEPGRTPECVGYEKTAVRGDGGTVPSLYEWRGGEEAMLRLTVVNSRPGVKEYDAPTPKWNWDGHPPYRE